MFQIEWTPALEVLGARAEREYLARFHRAAPKIGHLLVQTMRRTKKWKNQSGAADASLGWRVVSSSNGIMVLELYGTAYYLQWVEGGSRYLGFPSRYESMPQAVEASVPGALDLVISEVFG